MSQANHSALHPTFIAAPLPGSLRPTPIPTSAPTTPPLTVVPRARPVMLSKHSSDNPESEQPDLTVYRNNKRRLYNGDLLPFDVSVISPPPTYLGRFRLDSRTHCGDVLEYDESQFVVKRVKMVYKYTSAGLRVIRKEIDVKSLARKALEGYLERVWRES